MKERESQWKYENHKTTLKTIKCYSELNKSERTYNIFMDYAISGNYRTLLIELMVTDPSSTVYILQDSEYNDVVGRMENAGLVCFCYKRKRSRNEFINLFAYYKQDLKLRKILKLLRFDKNNDRFFGCDHICALFKYFRSCKNITVIEEGFSNYTNKRQLYDEYGIGTFRFFMLRLVMFQWNLLTYKPYGYDASVKELWLTGLRDIPEELSNKTKIINLEELWEESNQKIINQVFNFDKDIYYNKSVIITQPLSEDKICSEERKIKIYSNLIKRSDYPVIIKKHPRDTTDYRSFFKEVIVDTDSYPFELLILNKPKFRQVLTISSTAAYQCIGLCDVIIIGTLNYPDLQKKLGVHKEIIFRKGEKEVWKNKKYF